MLLNDLYLSEIRLAPFTIKIAVYSGMGRGETPGEARRR